MNGPGQGHRCLQHRGHSTTLGNQTCIWGVGLQLEQQCLDNKGLSGNELVEITTERLLSRTEN